MPKINWCKFYALLLVVIMIGQLITSVICETLSFRNTATVLETVHPGSSAKENLIDRKYKARIFQGTAIGSYNDYSKWFTIDQGSSKTVVTVLIVQDASDFSR